MTINNWGGIAFGQLAKKVQCSIRKLIGTSKYDNV